jgi:hypothetical protein
VGRQVAALFGKASGVMVNSGSSALYLAVELAYRGHLQEAYAVDRRLLHDPNASRFSAFLDPFLSLSLLGGIP